MNVLVVQRGGDVGGGGLKPPPSRLPRLSCLSLQQRTPRCRERCPSTRPSPPPCSAGATGVPLGRCMSPPQQGQQAGCPLQATKNNSKRALQVWVPLLCVHPQRYLVFDASGGDSVLSAEQKLEAFWIYKVPVVYNLLPILSKALVILAPHIHDILHDR